MLAFAHQSASVQVVCGSKLLGGNHLFDLISHQHLGIYERTKSAIVMIQLSFSVIFGTTPESQDEGHMYLEAGVWWANKSL